MPPRRPRPSSTKPYRQLDYVQTVQADAKAFSDLLPNYQVNPGLFEQQQLVQTMGQALTNVNFKTYLPTTADGEPVELRLMLNREPPEPKSGRSNRNSWAVATWNV